jgi:pyrroline-5-carboxylate reductase
VLIGVKPVMVPDLLREIAPVLRPGTIVVSLAAGVTIATFASIVGEEVSVIRSMPNTPAVVGKAVTGLSAGPTASADELALVRRLFETCGRSSRCRVADRRPVDDLGIGSGLLLPAGRGAHRGRARQGLLRRRRAPDGRADLHRRRGAAGCHGEDPAELRRRVTSPKGTTERAIAVLQGARLDGVFAEATDAARPRQGDGRRRLTPAPAPRAASRPRETTFGTRNHHRRCVSSPLWFLTALGGEGAGRLAQARQSGAVARADEPHVRALQGGGQRFDPHRIRHFPARDRMPRAAQTVLAALLVTEAQRGPRASLSPMPYLPQPSLSTVRLVGNRKSVRSVTPS